MRVVLDTNILVSALLFPGGAPWRAFQLLSDGALQNATSTYILNELRGVLARKFGHDERFVSDSVKVVANLSRLVEPASQQPDIKINADDLPVVACAIDSHAKYLVTGDKAMLAVTRYRRIQFVTARDMLTIYEKSGEKKS